MRVLMLGWEFPPYISGGLGTACYGLTRALARQGAKIIFVLPRLEQPNDATNPAIKSAEQTDHWYALLKAADPTKKPQSASSYLSQLAAENNQTNPYPTIKNLTIRPVKSTLVSPYTTTQHTPAKMKHHLQNNALSVLEVSEFDHKPHHNGPHQKTGFALGSASNLSFSSRVHSMALSQNTQTLVRDFVSPQAMLNEQTYDPYAGDIVAHAHEYAYRCLKLACEENFDVIHAHDWMTFPAAAMIAKQLKKPMVAHIHSTEFDRSGEQINQGVYQLERRGLEAADSILTVSYLTRSTLHQRYGINAQKIHVAYNGIELEVPGEALQKASKKRLNKMATKAQQAKSPPQMKLKQADRIVLFLGRITMQKGPEYFVQAAQKVLYKIKKVKFVIAGAGDQLVQIREMTQQAGIAEHVLFPGFLRHEDVIKAYRMADVYVMPSVSEPFGLTTLEAISHDVPVIVSKTSGVGEVLNHVLKVDFWNTTEMANKIIAVLKHPHLGNELRTQADKELGRLTWDNAANTCMATYDSLIH